MKSLVTSIRVLEVLRYNNLFELRHTQLLIDRNILLVTLSIVNPTNTLPCECQVVFVLMANSEVFPDLLEKPGLRTSLSR